MTPSPDVTIVIPCYQQAHLLPDALDSARRQAPAKVEIIVVDDCSPFPVSDYLAGAGYGQYPSVKVVRNPVNQGPAGTRNHGIAVSRGNLLAFLDSDDYWDPHKLEKQLALYERRPGLDVVYCDMWIANGDKVTPSGKKLFNANLWENLVQGWWTPPNPSTMLITREALERLNRFDPNLWGTEDLDLWMRIARHDMRVDYCPECLSYFTFDSNDRITKHKDKLKRANAFLSKWEQYFSQTGDRQNLHSFRNNSATKFALETFVDALRDGSWWGPVKVYFGYLWNKKAFYDLVLGKLTRRKRGAVL